MRTAITNHPQPGFFRGSFNFIFKCNIRERLDTLSIIVINIHINNIKYEIEPMTAYLVEI